MPRYRIHNLHSGATFGEYEGEDAAEAVAAMHRDAGYPGVRAENGRLTFPDDETARLCGDIGEAWSAELAENTAIHVTNPFGGAWVAFDRAAITQDQLDAWAPMMGDELREELHSALAPCTPGDFVAAWVDRVGPDEAGRVMVGA